MSERMHVIVAVKDELGPFLLEHRREFRAVGKPLEMPAGGRHWRVMDEHDAEESLPPAFVKKVGEPRELLVPESAGCHEGGSRHRAAQADQRHRTAAPDERKPDL